MSGISAAAIIERSASVASLATDIRTGFVRRWRRGHGFSASLGGRSGLSAGSSRSVSRSTDED
jgi:hypothetical protein